MWLFGDSLFAYVFFFLALLSIRLLLATLVKLDKAQKRKHRKQDLIRNGLGSRKLSSETTEQSLSNDKNPSHASLNTLVAEEEEETEESIFAAHKARDFEALESSRDLDELLENELITYAYELQPGQEDFIPTRTK